MVSNRVQRLFAVMDSCERERSTVEWLKAQVSDMAEDGHPDFERQVRLLELGFAPRLLMQLPPCWLESRLECRFGETNQVSGGCSDFQLLKYAFREAKVPLDHHGRIRVAGVLMYATEPPGDWAAEMRDNLGWLADQLKCGYEVCEFAAHNPGHTTRGVLFELKGAPMPVSFDTELRPAVLDFLEKEAPDGSPLTYPRVAESIAPVLDAARVEWASGTALSFVFDRLSECRKYDKRGRRLRDCGSSYALHRRS
jgi:hypothetical protein